MPELSAEESLNIVQYHVSFYDKYLYQKIFCNQLWEKQLDNILEKQTWLKFMENYWYQKIDIITENTYLKSCKSTRTSIEQASSY